MLTKPLPKLGLGFCEFVFADPMGGIAQIGLGWSPLYVDRIELDLLDCESLQVFSFNYSAGRELFSVADIFFGHHDIVVVVGGD